MFVFENRKSDSRCRVAICELVTALIGKWRHQVQKPKKREGFLISRFSFLLEEYE